ncbi:hypothetical protein VaNZ11_016363 [Volvox africanus]|uniref:RAP domain-containing protein n=1 Tax=Volvox africanus TaxID=51714 RepID=A0ABQ5SPE2_9CHLO|nr:hypothetical protein VaNZ11_016363 [Volvox africanus]
MLKGFLLRPSIRLGGRRHACCRPRCRGRAASLSAPPSGSSTSALRESQHSSDSVARLGALPCAVLSCAPSAVDRQGSEHSLHGVGNNDSSSSDFQVWRFKVATYEEGQHLHGGVRTGTSPATSHDATATTAGNDAHAIATASTGTGAFSGVNVDVIASNSNGSGNNRTPPSPLSPDRGLRDHGDGSYSQEEPRKDNGSSSVGTRGPCVATSELPAGSDLFQRLASPEVMTYDSRDVKEIPRSETNSTASSSSSSTSNVTSGSSSSHSGGRQRRRQLRLPAERRWQQHGGKNVNPEAVRLGGRHPEARPMGRHRQTDDDNSGDEEGGERLGARSGSSSSSCIGSSASPSTSPSRSRDRTGLACGPASGDTDEFVHLAGASLEHSVGRRSRGGDRSLHTVPSWLEARRINQAIIEAGAWRQYRKILQLVECHVRDFDRINTATALHRLGSCGLQPGSWEAKRVLTDPRFSRLMETLAGDYLTSLTAREVSNCLWALAKLGYSPGRHCNAVADAGSANSHGGSSCGGRSDDSGSSSNRDGGTTGNGGSCSSPGLLEGLCARVEMCLASLGPQEVANSLWALGTLGHHPGEHLLRGLTNRLLEVLPRAQPQEVSSALLGVAKLEWNPGPCVLDRVAHGSLTQIRKFNTQELSNTLWSLARLGHYNEHLQAAIFHQAVRRVSDFKPPELSSLALAAATMGLGPRGGEVGDSAREGGSYWRDGAGASSRVGGRAGSTGIPHQYFQKGLMPEQLLRTLCDQAAATVQVLKARATPNSPSSLHSQPLSFSALLAPCRLRGFACQRVLGLDWALTYNIVRPNRGSRYVDLMSACPPTRTALCFFEHPFGV